MAAAAELRQKRAEVGGRGQPEMEPLARDRMDEPEDGRVERQPPDRERVGLGIPVDGVPEHRMTE
ncbi:MAG: hypothetical protein B7Z68_12915, partial [Acidobacteria bacterium 21-70-11]